MNQHSRQLSLSDESIYSQCSQRKSVMKETLCHQGDGWDIRQTHNPSKQKPGTLFSLQMYAGIGSGGGGPL